MTGGSSAGRSGAREDGRVPMVSCRERQVVKVKKKSGFPAGRNAARGPGPRVSPPEANFFFLGLVGAGVTATTWR